MNERIEIFLELNLPRCKVEYSVSDFRINQKYLSHYSNVLRSMNGSYKTRRQGHFYKVSTYIVIVIFRVYNLSCV